VKILLQRVINARVELENQVVASIGMGLLAYVGVGPSDLPEDAMWLANKVAGLRIFEDSQGKMNLCVRDVKGGVLAIPNFTLMGDARKGRRPSFGDSADPKHAGVLFDFFLIELKSRVDQVAGGLFGKHMIIENRSDGPVNIIIDSPLGNTSQSKDQAKNKHK